MAGLILPGNVGRNRGLVAPPGQPRLRQGHPLLAGIQENFVWPGFGLKPANLGAPSMSGYAGLGVGVMGHAWATVVGTPKPVATPYGMLWSGDTGGNGWYYNAQYQSTPTTAMTFRVVGVLRNFTFAAGGNHAGMIDGNREMLLMADGSGNATATAWGASQATFVFTAGALFDWTVVCQASGATASYLNGKPLGAGGSYPGGSTSQSTIDIAAINDGGYQSGNFAPIFIQRWARSLTAPEIANAYSDMYGFLTFPQDSVYDVLAFAASAPAAPPWGGMSDFDNTAAIAQRIEMIPG